MPAFIPWLLTAFFGGLKWVMGSLAAQVLIGLGIGVATYTGMDVTMEWLVSQSLGNLNALPPELLGLLGYMRVGEALNIVVSAMAMRLSMTAVRNAAGVLAVKRFFKA